MPYYDTIDEDLARAKTILAEGRAEPVAIGGQGTEFIRPGGTIYGKDIYAAYCLLESFVQEIERLRGTRFPFTTE